MKKFTLLAFTLLVLQFNLFGQDRTISLNELPAKSQAFLSEHFKGDALAYATKDTELLSTSYDVILTSGAKIEFYSSGEWESVTCKASKVPDSVVPQNIIDYVALHYSPAQIVEINKEKSGYEVELNNKLDLKFSKKGVFLGIDD